MNFCPKCRHKLIVPDFCVECGSDLSEYLKQERGDAPITQQYPQGAVNTAAYDNVITDGNVLVKYTGKSRTFNIPAGIKEIYSEAFAGNDVISAVTIPEGVTVIGKGAFKGCRSLKTVNLPSTLAEIYEEAFMGCTELEEVVIPKNITELREGVFYNCSKLGKITIPSSLKSAGKNALSSCNNTMDIYISSLEAWCSISGLTNIMTSRAYNRIFLSNRLLTAINLNGNTTAISDYAFIGCKDITNITLPYGLKSIGEYAFYGCGIYTVSIPSGVSAIGGYAFSFCTNLAHVNFNCNVPGSIALSYADKRSTVFLGCDKLESVTIGYGVTHIGENAFSDIRSLKKVELPSTITFIGNYAFHNCKGLTSITLPLALKEIGISAFEGCSELRSIEFPYNLESIGNRAFAGCIHFTEITVPDAVNSIGAGAFAGCKSLTRISLPFVGVSRDATRFNGAFGVIFGYTPNQRDATPTHIEQYIEKRESTFSSENYARYYYDIPPTLRTVNVTSATQLSDYAFRNCHMLTNIDLPSTLCEIKKEAFSGCNGLTKIYVPTKVSEIGEGAFSNMIGLTDIFVSMGNLHYSSVSGNLYTKYGDKLIQYATGKTATHFTVPSTVRYIAPRAFANVSALVSVTLPEYLSDIGDYAFEYCSSLKEITIPPYIKSVSRTAFSDCYHLKIKVPAKCSITLGYGSETVIYY